MKQTKIDWCDCTLNPVKGCPNGCGIQIRRQAMKIKAERMGELENFGFKENVYPANSFILNNDIVVEPNRNILVLTKQGAIILQHIKAFGMVEE